MKAKRKTKSPKPNAALVYGAKSYHLAELDLIGRYIAQHCTEIRNRIEYLERIAAQIARIRAEIKANEKIQAHKPTFNCQAESSRAEPTGSTDGEETVIDEYVRLDKTIRDCEHALIIAERLNVHGRHVAESEIEPVRRKLQEKMIERDFLDEWLHRRGKSWNDE